MPSNNQAQDRYNPPGTTQADWETDTFSSLDVGDLFWLNQNPNGDINVVHRKISEHEGQQLKTRTVNKFNSHLKVFLKT